MLNLNARLLQQFCPDATVSCAFMHSAARLIQGTTLHGEFGMGLDAQQTLSATALRSLTQRWRCKRVLRIDEISMVSAELLGRTEQTARVAKQKIFQSWGGLLIDLSGDIQQLPPVWQCSLLVDPRPVCRASAADSETSQTAQALARRGRDIWLQVASVVFLDYSRRCSGDLADVLREMQNDTVLSDASWSALQRRVLSHPNAARVRAQVRAGLFADRSCRAGVLRHDVRAALCQHRELQHAANAGSPLFVSVAADRCTDTGCPRDLTENDYIEMLRVTNLSKTKQLQGFLFLYEGMTVVLEDKLSPKLGLVRGCPCIVSRILFDVREPTIDNAQPGELHVLRYVPEALILQVDAAAWTKERALGPGRFYLPSRRRSWNARLPDSTNSTITIERLQLPVTNDTAATAYGLQGQTLPRGIFSLGHPDSMSRDEMWISLFVLLSRTPSLDDMVFLELPKRACFEGGPPAFLKVELRRLRALEATTLRQLHTDLLHWGFPDAAEIISSIL